MNNYVYIKFKKRLKLIFLKSVFGKKKLDKMQEEQQSKLKKILGIEKRCGTDFLWDFSTSAYPFAKKGQAVPDSKGVVYTCVTHNYDSYTVHEKYDGQCDYKLFTDSESAVVENTECINIDTLNISEQGSDINRYVKLHPSELFGSEYDFSVYIDGSIKITSDVAGLYSVARDSKCGIAMHLHKDRKCIYDEALACIELQKGNTPAIKKQVQEYMSEGFPENFGLLEATVIVVDLHNPNAKLIFDAWWSEYKRSQSMRDQLSFPYVLWKLGYSCEDIGVLGNNILFNPMFKWYNHC